MTLILDLHLGGKKTKLQQKVRIWKLLHPYMTLHVASAFAGIVVFHATGVDSSILVADHCHPSPDPFLDEQMLTNISEKVQFHVRCFKTSLKGKTRGNVIIGRKRKKTKKKRQLQSWKIKIYDLKPQRQI